MSDFTGKIVLVTGAASGMGQATAIAFARQGARVMVADVNEAGGAETVARIAAAGGTAAFQRTNVSNPEQVAALVEATVATFGRLDVAMNNAAILGPWTAIADHATADIHAVFDINVKGVVFGMRQQLAQFLKQGDGGVIINVASVQGYRVVFPGSSLYAASKSAVIALTKAAALEYGAHNIRVVGIAPGPIDTPMLRSATTDDGSMIKSLVPLHTIGTGDDIAEAALWLASPAARYVTGAVLPVDGGFLAP